MKRVIVTAIALTTIGLAVRAKKTGIKRGKYSVGFEDRIVYVELNNHHSHKLIVDHGDKQETFYLTRESE